MKLEALLSKPQLVKVTIDDADIVQRYGEALEFYIYDRQDMDTYMRLAAVDGDETNLSKIANIVKDIILDEKGKKIITDNNILPVDVMIKVIEVTIKNLGNAASQTSTK